MRRSERLLYAANGVDLRVVDPELTDRRRTPRWPRPVSWKSRPGQLVLPGLPPSSPVQRVRRVWAAALGRRSRVKTPFLLPSTR